MLYSFPFTRKLQTLAPLFFPLKFVFQGSNGDAVMALAGKIDQLLFLLYPEGCPAHKEPIKVLLSTDKYSFSKLPKTAILS